MKTYNGITHVNVKDSDVHIELLCNPLAFWRNYQRAATLDEKVEGSIVTQKDGVLTLEKYKGPLVLPSGVRTDLYVDSSKLVGSHPGGDLKVDKSCEIDLKSPTYTRSSEGLGYLAEAGKMTICLFPAAVIMKLGGQEFLGINPHDYWEWLPLMAAGMRLGYTGTDNQKALTLSILTLLGITFGPELVNLPTHGLHEIGMEDVGKILGFLSSNAAGYLGRMWKSSLSD